MGTATASSIDSRTKKVWDLSNKISKHVEASRRTEANNTLQQIRSELDSIRMESGVTELSGYEVGETK